MHLIITVRSPLDNDSTIKKKKPKYKKKKISTELKNKI